LGIVGVVKWILKGIGEAGLYLQYLGGVSWHVPCYSKLRANYIQERYCQGVDKPRDRT